MHDQSDGVVRCLQVNTAIAHQSLGEENWDDKGGAASISHRSKNLPLSLSLFLQFDRSSNLRSDSIEFEKVSRCYNRCHNRRIRFSSFYPANLNSRKVSKENEILFTD